MTKPEQMAGGAVDGSPATEPCPALTAAKKAVEEIVAACGGVSRGWSKHVLEFNIEDKEAFAVLSLDKYGGKCTIEVGEGDIYVDLERRRMVIGGWIYSNNFISFRLPGRASKVCTALRILASDCEDKCAVECRERKVERLAKELRLREVRY